MPSEQQLTKAIINMAVEAWHFKEAFEQMIAKAKPEDARAATPTARRSI